LENLKALEVLPKITDEHMKKIDELLGNAPEVPVVSLIILSFFYSK
jgi:hypothetical protein